MNTASRIYVAGHRGLVGSGLVRALERAGCSNLVLRTHAELDLTDRRAVEQFFRADEARRLVPDGSGIGLYAARGLIEAMGGTLEIASEPGSGTTVTIALPAETAEEQTAPAEGDG